MEVRNTIFNEVKLVTPQVYEDNRGFFMETYSFAKLKNYEIENVFIQDNHSFSKEKGTIRGLHYQLNPKGQAKLVRVVKGAIFDVVVDIRENSSNFGRWYGVELSAENKRQLFIPTGFAHGFCTLEEDTEVVYKVDEYYVPELERGIVWNDQDININWPIDIPILSEKDQALPKLTLAEI